MKIILPLLFFISAAFGQDAPPPAQAPAPAAGAPPLRIIEPSTPAIVPAPLPQPVSTPVTGKRVALVIGNDRYTTSPLLNCVSDASAMSKLLREQLQFDLVLADAESENLDRLAFTRRLQRFQKEAHGAAVALFYYAGHGMEDFDGRDNYLIPVDANLAEAVKDNAGLQAQGIPLDFVLKTMKDSTKGAKIILLDCCRQRPADRALSTRDGGGFVMPPDADMPQDTLIMLAAAPARVASDGAKHGPFTAALLKHLPSPGTALFQTFRTVRNEVLTATNQQQKPWLKLDGAGDFFYDHALSAKQAAHASLLKVPSLPIALKSSQPLLGDGRVGKTVDVVLPGGVELPMCFVPAGSFTMGSPEGEANRFNYENQVQVILTKGFWMAQTELTQAQWRTLIRENPSEFKGDDLPVENMTLDNVDAFLAKMNETVKFDGWRWRLPSEAEWEYACRAGSVSAFSFGDSLDGTQANFDSINGSIPHGTKNRVPSLLQTTKVRSYRPNAWGLFDLHGNVKELCSDLWNEAASLPGGEDPIGRTGKFRITRGGAWDNYAIYCRSARRNIFLGPRSTQGFRCVLAIADDTSISDSPRSQAQSIVPKSTIKATPLQQVEPPAEHMQKEADRIGDMLKRARSQLNNR